MFHRKLLLALGVLLWVGGFSACKSDEFEGEPTARAPEEPLVDQKRAEKRGRRIRSEQVPSGHPPVRSGGAPPSGPAAGGPPSGGRPAAPSGASKLPVDWKVPSNWKEVEPSSRMRKAEFRIPGADGAGPATLAVFHLPGSRGKLQSNIDRWIGQFDPPGDAEASEVAKTSTRQVNGEKVYLVRMRGTYKGMGRSEPKENQRLLGAIVKTDSGPVFFKMVGPAPTVAARESEFDAFVGSFKTSP